MKRSEMLDLIDEYVLDELYNSGLSLEGAIGIDLCDVLLKGIERAGMLPPTVMLHDGRLVSCEDDQGFIIYEENEWEEEK